MNESELEHKADDLALARYSVIAPLVCRQLGPGERTDTRNQILAAVHAFPDGARKVSERCLSRWVLWHNQGHIDESGEVVTEPGIERAQALAEA